MKENAQHKIRRALVGTAKSVAAVSVIMGGLMVSFHPAIAGFEEGRKALKQGAYEAAWNEFLPLAEAGVTAAQCRIAEMLRDGRGVERDLNAAAEWFRRAAERGMARAQFALANMYWRGRGIQRSEQEAHRLFQAAYSEVLLSAEQGNVGEQLALARMYRFGLGVEQDIEQAGYWYAQASAVLRPWADAGNPKAATKLARILIDGIGVPKDFAEAIRLYRIAAERGDAGAQFNLGKILFNGIGEMVRQPREAIPFLTAAAASGNARAKVMLGLAFARGKGTERDPVEAFKWLRLAELQGIPNATRLLEEVTPQMSVNDLETGRQRVRQWREQGPDGNFGGVEKSLRSDA